MIQKIELVSDFLGSFEDKVNEKAKKAFEPKWETFRMIERNNGEAMVPYFCILMVKR